MTLMSSKLQSTIWSRDTCQRIPCFARCQLTVTCPISKQDAINQGCMSLSTYQLEYGHHFAQLCHRHFHAYRPTSNTASHGNHEKINSWVFFTFLYGYGAPLDSPSGCQNSAIKITIIDQLVLILSLSHQLSPCILFNNTILVMSANQFSFSLILM